MAPRKAPTVPKAPPAVPTTKTDPFEGNTHLVDDVLTIDNVVEKEVSSTSASTIAPKAPPSVPTTVETAEMPNTLLVQHNVTKKQFRVSKRYFETYSSVLTRVD